MAPLEERDLARLGRLDRTQRLLPWLGISLTLLGSAYIGIGEDSRKGSSGDGRSAVVVHLLLVAGEEAC